jgi:hypothetical protein
MHYTRVFRPRNSMRKPSPIIAVRLRGGLVPAGTRVTGGPAEGENARLTRGAQRERPYREGVRNADLDGAPVNPRI